MKSKTLPNKKTYVALHLTKHYSIVTNINNLIFKRNNPSKPKKINHIEHTRLSLTLNNYGWSIIINDSDANSKTILSIFYKLKQIHIQ